MSLEEVSALILAGGRSRRMGVDKALLVLDGEPLLARVVRRVLPLAGEIIVSAREPRAYDAVLKLLAAPVRIVVDEFADAGPLAGLHAGLTAARHDLLLALSVDLPFVDPGLLAHMIDLAGGFDAVVPRVPASHGYTLELEPLHALYRRTCLPAIESHLRAGDRRMTSILDDVLTRYLQPHEITRIDPGFRSFANINTPEDWEAAQSLAGPR